jgi:uncharacterized protein YggE
MIRLAWRHSLLAVFALSSLASAQEVNHRIITATGTATVRFKPDAVRIQCAVRSFDLSADTAKEANQKAAKGLFDGLAALKMKEMKISTGPVNVTQSSTAVRRIVGGVPMVDPRQYIAAHPVTIILVDSDVDRLRESIEKIGKVLIESGANGDMQDDNGFMSSRYRTSDSPVVSLMRRDDAEYRDEAMTLAVQKAMRTAKALAKGAGVQIKETVSISETELTPGDTSSPSAPANRSISGELEITVRVTVKCSY